MPERFLSGLRFELVATILADRDAAGRVFSESPARRYANPKNQALQPYGRGPFGRLSLATDETRPGVFALFAGDRLAFIGKTSASLGASFGPLGIGQIEPRACYESRDAVRCRVNAGITQLLSGGAAIAVYFHPTHLAADLERSLVATVAPAWNDPTGARIAPTAMPPTVAAAIRELHLGGKGVPEISALLHIREALAYRIVAKMDRHRFEVDSNVG